jgi:hypothetical protein
MQQVGISLTYTCPINNCKQELRLQQPLTCINPGGTLPNHLSAKENNSADLHASGTCKAFSPCHQVQTVLAKLVIQSYKQISNALLL